MKQLKHIGRIKNTGAKVIVVFRTLPGDSGSALVVSTANLKDSYHDAIMELVESAQGQDAWELGEILHTRFFPDGRPMLAGLGQDQRLQRVPTDHVIMTPTPTSELPLDQLNVLIAEQKNCSIGDLAQLITGAPEKSLDYDKSKNSKQQETVQSTTETPQSNGVLSDLDLAKSYRSQADAMYKEAARLRKEADALDPPKKKTTKATETTETANA